ncbi:hypothetical protein QL285_064546 [Trifolium repens]|nr:hypothetical protein QL285_064546 [Trifolium repens]
MDRNRSKKNVVERSKSQKGKKKLDASASKSIRTNALRKVKAKSLPVSPSSSSSDDIDEDYAEFLKTYVLMIRRGRRFPDYCGIRGEDAEIFEDEIF